MNYEYWIIGILALLISLYFLRPKSSAKTNQIVLWGPCGSCKTALFYYVI